MNRVGTIVAAVIAVSVWAVPSAQVPGLAGLLDRIFTSRPTLSSSLDTADGLFPFLPDSFEPDSFQPATWLQRTATGGFVIEPGAWEFQAESYCLKVGTPRPSTGDGFAWAPLAGPRAAIIQHILQTANRVPAVTQEQIQILLWAIVARTELRDLDAPLQQAARLLLSPREIAELSTNTLGRISRQALEDNMNRLPAIAQQVTAAEASVRELAARHASYAEIAAVAAPEDADAGEHLRDVPRGRWIRRGRYFVRFLPTGYDRVTVQFYMPSILGETANATALRQSMGPRPRAFDDGRMVAALFRPSPAFGFARTAAQGRGAPTFEPSTGTAVPGDSGGQRLGISTRSSPDWHPPPPGPDPRPRPRPRKPVPPDRPDPPEECDPSPEDLAGAAEMWNDWANSLEEQAHQYDEAERSSCPPSYSAEEEAQFAYAREMIANYGGSDVPRERDYAACVRQNVVNYRAGQQMTCDNIADYRRRMQDHAKRARDLARDWASDPKGAFCKGKASVDDVARDQEPDAFPPPPAMGRCTPP